MIAFLYFFIFYLFSVICCCFIPNDQEYQENDVIDYDNYDNDMIDDNSEDIFDEFSD